ncbi:hypothetical protein [Microbispora hainanensis]|uniref:Transposase n=1 Tax=Microbispora hainanensis TaxID=568844 RepID=A0A544YMK6_9ACTN|nr:hypothetical protein [Microbispora hainanensis]TQS17999.1 hypothetical protein FLX08_26270 [Microbispora hainanensis]
MQAVIAEAGARGQVDLDLVSVDSTTARAHHHAAGTALDGELLSEASGLPEDPKSVQALDP